MDLTYDPKAKKLSDGHEVVQVEYALVRHPHPDQHGKMVETKSVLQLFVLSTDPDETEFIHLFACNFGLNGNPCFKVFDRVQAVVGHMPSHTPKAYKKYTDDQLRTVVRECKKAIAAGHKNFAQIASDELNALGMINLKGQPMTNNLVSHLYVENKSKYRIHIKPRTTERKDVAKFTGLPNSSITLRNDDGNLTIVNASEVSVPTASTRVTGTRPKHDIVRLLDDLQSRITDAHNILLVITTEVYALVERVEKHGTVNDEIREKAEKYDQMKNLLGRD